MGETRAKKSSKRAQKMAQRTEVASDLNSLSLAPEIERQKNNAQVQLSTSASDSLLAPLALSSRESRSSLQSSRSSTSTTARHDLNIYDPSRTEVRSTPNKGYALFAALHIPQGAIVLAERPAIRLTDEDEARKNVADEILEEKLQQLPKIAQRGFKKLHDSKKDGFPKLRSIYHSNCYNLEGSRSTLGGSCIGLKASRINHSCIPNVQFTFLEIIPESLLGIDEDGDDAVESDLKEPHPVGGIMVFRALKAISKGKEIVSNYETIYATRSQRQWQLQIHYGFQCDCDACTASSEFWATNDDRRQKMIRYRDKIDAVEQCIMKKMELSLSGIGEVEVEYLRSEESEDSAADTDGLLLLSRRHCDSMISMLAALDLLLVKEGLTGIELQRVREKKNEWMEKRLACYWAAERDDKYRDSPYYTK